MQPYRRSDADLRADGTFRYEWTYPLEPEKKGGSVEGRWVREPVPSGAKGSEQYFLLPDDGSGRRLQYRGEVQIPNAGAPPTSLGEKWFFPAIDDETGRLTDEWQKMDPLVSDTPTSGRE